MRDYFPLPSAKLPLISAEFGYDAFGRFLAGGVMDDLFGARQGMRFRVRIFADAGFLISRQKFPPC